MAKKKTTKEVIENSIQIYGIGHPETKTVFSIEKEEDRNHFRFKSLETISGRTLTVGFKYKDGEEEKSGTMPMVIVKSDEENDIKAFILSEISNYLNK